MTIKAATEKWVRDFNSIPTGMIEALGDEFTEVTDPDFTDCENELYPMWDTMWSFDSPFDNYWLEEKNGIQKMSECGFRVYYSENYGYFFGIDGAGYDFYDEHWVPLYKARGLNWHDTSHNDN